MCNLKVLWRGTPTYKRVLLRKISWHHAHYRNCKLFVRQLKHGHFNIQFIIAGIRKCNGEVSIRFLNRELVLGW